MEPLEVRNPSRFSEANENRTKVATDRRKKPGAKQRNAKINDFLRHLAQDPALSNPPVPGYARQLFEWLRITEYPIKQELVYDYHVRRFVPSSNKPTIDLAELMNMLLRKRGLDCTFEDLVDHVLSGGSIDEFLTLHR
jgi:hypothetical protein